MHQQFQSIPIMLEALDEDDFEHLQARVTELFLDDKSISVEIKNFLTAVISLSPYLQDCLFKEQNFLKNLFTRGFDESFQTIITKTKSMGCEFDSEADFMVAIRKAKRQTALLCGLADMGGWWDGDKVTSVLSQFACTSLRASMDFVLLETHHAEKIVLTNIEIPQQDCGFIILGMGKLGAGELNYSSDIDLIFIFDDQAPVILNTDDPISLLSRMAKKLIKLMQERTGDGYVFRMDIRLRPDPASTPLVVPIVAALNYYEGQGQNWERAAMIKARPVAGDIKAGASFLKELEPFIWRKYLDFAAINDVQSIKRQIHAHKGHGEIAVLGHNIKLGRGGIREIEFFAQTQQLIAGGRNEELRVNETIKALHVLHQHDWIEKDAVDDLSKVYWFLRDLEHRLQMVDDQQTHILPDSEDALKRIALMSGEADVKKFMNSIREALVTVEKYYSELFEQASALGSDEGNLVFTGDEHDPETVNSLHQMGFERPNEIIKIIKTWHIARIPALRATQARELLTELVPDLLKAFSNANNPDDVVFTFDRFLSGLPAGIQLFSILKINPFLFDLLIKILSTAPRLADQIARKPHVFDAMIDPQFGQGAIGKEALSNILNASMVRISDYELALDEARRFFTQTQFMIGCQFLAGTLSVNKTALAFSLLADVVIEAMLKLVMNEFSLQHGHVKGGKVCILGMGRLGSYELTATSDLDLIFLYEFDETCEESCGKKPLPTSLYFIRLMQRFIAAMSSPTTEGKLFELDFRLRPSGNAGPLATQLDAFIKYQRNEAWVWEAQSLTRARPIAGDPELCEKLAKEIPEILSTHMQNDKLEFEIHDMRKRIAKEKEAKDIWDVKLVSGGLLDVEFIAQWLSLKNGADGKTATRDILCDPKHADLSFDVREKLINAFDLYNAILQLKRICLGAGATIDDQSKGFNEMVTTIMDTPDMASAKAQLTMTQKQVSEIFKLLLKKKPQT